MTYDEAVHRLIYGDDGKPGPVWVGERLRINSQAVNGWFQEGKRVPPGRDLELAHIFGVDPAALRQGQIVQLAGAPPAVERIGEVDPEIIRNFPNSREDQLFLGLWIHLNDDIKLIAIEFLSAVTKIIPRKVS
jgi:hypothetical protein